MLSKQHAHLAIPLRKRQGFLLCTKTNLENYLQVFCSQKTNGNQKILHINHKMDIFIRTTEKKRRKNNEK